MIVDSQDVAKIVESFEPFTQLLLISGIFYNGSRVSKPGIVIGIILLIKLHALIRNF